jgi:predicted NACHT family NTPase
VDNTRYSWTRFWVQRGGHFSLADGGFLADPETPVGAIYNPTLVQFSAIPAYPVLVLLGEPGIGKTTAMDAAYQVLESQSPRGEDKLLQKDLREYGSDTTLLNGIFGSDAFREWEQGTYNLYIFLDSLDECRLRINNVAQMLSGRLQDCPVDRLFLRILCRTAEWPSLLEDELRKILEKNDAIKRVWGDKALGIYELAPLRRNDAIEAAGSFNLNADDFLAEVERKDVVPFAIKPITLNFLLRNYRKKNQFPHTRAALYADGCRVLCEETNKSRATSGLTGTLSSEQRLIVAARIAAITIFGNRYAVWTGTDAEDNPYENDDVSLRQLCGDNEEVGGQQFAVTKAAVMEALGTGLFSSRGRERIGWAHQTYAEFLAAWYLIQHQMTTEQIMSLIKHTSDPEGRLITQLHETAAWLASLDTDVFQEIMKLDPAVLLRSDVATASMSHRAQLVESLMTEYEGGKLPDFDWSVRSLYHRLNHPKLATQLRAYIVENGTSDKVRGIAIDIAESCGLDSLSEDLATLALDPSEPMHQRINAAAAVTRIGTAEAKARLKPLIVDPAYTDVDDELKGAALLALWPKHMSAEELFAALKSPQDIGSLNLYSSFFYGDQMQHLQTSDVPVALAWIEQLPEALQDDPMYHHTIDSILWRAWECLGAPDIDEPLAHILMKRKRYRNAVLGEDRITQSLIGNDTKRHSLLGTLIRMMLASGEHPRHIAWAGLILSKDIAWLMDQMEIAKSEEEQRAIVQLSNAALVHDDMQSLEAIWRANERNPIVMEEFRWLLKGYDIRSAEAATLREFYQHEQKMNSRPLLKPSPSERVTTLLDRFEKGELEAWWILNREMTLKPDSTHYMDHLEFVSDLRVLPVWEAADEDTRARIIKGASNYLMGMEDPKMKEWLGKNVLHRPAYAGFRALRFLLNEESAALDALPEEVWRRWAPVTIGYQHSGASIEDSADQHRLVEIAYKHAPQEVLDSLLVVIDHQNRDIKSVSILRHIEECWDTLIANALVGKLTDTRLTPSSLGTILSTLLEHSVPQAREFAESLLSQPISSKGKKRERSLAAAQALAACASDAGWSSIWSIVQRDTLFGRELVERLVHTDRHNKQTPLSQRLSEDQLADLYIWLSHQYPHSEDLHPKGMHTVTTREEIQRWRDSVPDSIAERGSAEAIAALERTMGELPSVPYLENSLHRAKATRRLRTWSPMQPETLIRLAQNQQARLVENADQLLEVVIESLKRLEQELQGNTAAAGELWNYSKKGNKKVAWRPKDENEFSDRVKRHLEKDIKQKGIIVNREPEIRPGQELDLHIEAFVRSGVADSIGDTVKVVVESKGSWHDDLCTAMGTQLVNTYLKGSSSNTGLYLVGWFNCSKWASDDNRKAAAQRRAADKGVLQAKLDDQAKKLSRDGLRVKALVIDVSLQ